MSKLHQGTDGLEQLPHSECGKGLGECCLITEPPNVSPGRNAAFCWSKICREIFERESRMVAYQRTKERSRETVSRQLVRHKLIHEGESCWC
jgi:hypothetical protein